MNENIICCNCGSVNNTESINCESCGLSIIDEFEINGTKEEIPEMPTDMIKASTDQRPIKYDEELF